MMSTVLSRKIKSTNFKSTSISIYPHVIFTIELPGTDGLSFLDTLIKPTPNFTESTVYRKPIHTDRYFDYKSNHSISAKLSIIHILIHRAKEVSSTTKFLAKEMDHLHPSPTKQSLPSAVLSTSQPQQKAKPIHRNAHRRNQSCHTMHHRPQQTIQMYPSKIQNKFSLKPPAPSSIHSCIQRIQFQMFRQQT